MYLCDKDLRSLLKDLNFTTGDTEESFSPDDQIQPASIDLRLDRVFWSQLRRKKIDLRTAKLMEVEPHRHWRKRILGLKEGIKLKPGEMLLGRTFEKFTIPPGYAGKLEGRSSFARMGLAIHCSGDFINPGYGGHMPLQLINHSNSPIVLVPRLPICQLVVIPLSQESEKLYGDQGLHSKYVDDDGGPSYWWRDGRIKKIHKELGNRNVEDGVQREILDLIGHREPEVIDRFDDFLHQQKLGGITSAVDLLDEFAVREERTSKLHTCGYKTALWIGPAFLATALGTFLMNDGAWAHKSWWFLTLLCLGISGWCRWYCNPPGSYLTPREVRKLPAD